ncbi:Uncharacterized protein PECH_000223 [Penicillium ucsense]|uniref:Uncharacterized protein n=1 Tax=Penicillium ucsense TaxID=2839758 RepID=A0A8J8WM04_9EURO|nr:Uncharacterized protein PECM_008550 [Penicillium ucsense]KAF7738504.1 Uncharacterized protein PECH_000223 [Penicillium ucsense]
MTEFLPPSYRPAVTASPAERFAVNRVPGIHRKSPEALHLDDLELMMHWSTTTYRSLARDHAAEKLWQITIPQLALQFSHLQHGLMALAALQLARERPNPDHQGKYLVAAREHYRIALAGIPLDSTEDLTLVQCNAVFALCAVLLSYTFAHGLMRPLRSAAQDRSRPPYLDEYHEISIISRRIVGIMMQIIDRVAQGELHPLVEPDHSRPRMPDISQLLILALRQRNAREAKYSPTHEREVFDQTLDQLQLCLNRLMSGSEPRDFAFCWSSRTPARFHDLVQQRQPFALVIVAHYAVVLHHLHGLWWIGDWGTRILNEIVETVDPEWWEVMRWPIDATGCVLPEA